MVNFARFMKQKIEIIYKQFCANAASGQIYISWHFEKSSPIGKHPSKTNHFKICTLSFFEKIGKSKTKNNLG